jgi:hypothetical protein
VIELAKIFGEHGPAYREKFKGRIPASHLRAMAARFSPGLTRR